MSQILKEISKFNSDWKDVLELYFQKTKEKIDRILELSLKPLNISTKTFKNISKDKFLKMAEGKIKFEIEGDDISSEILIEGLIRVNYLGEKFHKVSIESLLDLRNYDEETSSNIERFVSWFKPFEK